MLPQGYSNNLSSEDRNKVLSEINQIHNQRFTITTTAITVFGVFIAWIIPKQDAQISLADNFLFIAPILLLLFLFLLFMYSHTLNQTLITLATYLVVIGQSKWERDSKAFRGKKAIGFAFMQNLIFILLGIITTGFPFMLYVLSGLTICAYQKSAASLIILGAIYTIVVTIVSFFTLERHEHKVKAKWTELYKNGII